MNFRLQSLKLHNYCQFQDFTFTPSPQGVTVLVGNNGAGKSNLLHSVCHALAPLIQILGSKSGTALKLPEECVSVKNNVKATNTNIQAEALLNDTLLSWTIFPKTSPRTEQPQQPPLKQQMSAASLAQPPLFRFFSAHAFETKNNEKLIQDFSPQTALENCLNDSNSLLLSWLFTQMKRKATAKRKKDKETETAISRQTDYVLNLLSIFAPTKEASPLSWHIKEQTLMIPQPKGGILPLSMLSDSDRFRLLLAGDLICRSVLLDRKSVV